MLWAVCYIIISLLQSNSSPPVVCVCVSTKRGWHREQTKASYWRVLASSSSVPILLRRFNYFQLESCSVACAFAYHNCAILHVSRHVVLWPPLYYYTANLVHKSNPSQRVCDNSATTSTYSSKYGIPVIVCGYRGEKEWQLLLWGLTVHRSQMLQYNNYCARNGHEHTHTHKLVGSAVHGCGRVHSALPGLREAGEGTDWGSDSRHGNWPLQLWWNIAVMACVLWHLCCLFIEF